MMHPVRTELYTCLVFETHWFSIKKKLTFSFVEGDGES